jgi:hypothetical protein
MFFNRKSGNLTLESLDARLREVEAQLALSSPVGRREYAKVEGLAPVGHSLAAALRSYAKSAGLRIDERRQ